MNQKKRPLLLLYGAITIKCHFFRCAKADPAALFDAALVRPSRNTADAAVAAFAEVTLVGATCDSVLPALVLEFAPVELLCRTFDALLAALEPVTLFDIFHSDKGCCREGRWYKPIVTHFRCLFVQSKCLFVQIAFTGTGDHSSKPTPSI